MRQAGQIVASALDAMREAVKPGVTTEQLDRLAETVIVAMGGIPSFKGYMGYPATICASVNEEIVHGIPGRRQLGEGDIVSLDVGAIWDGYQGDAAITVPVGRVGKRVQSLLKATEAALAAGIGAARTGARLGDVSHAIEQVAVQAGFGIIREYGGHAIGRQMHEAPNIPNWGPAGQGILLKEGMTLALEPMLSVGGVETMVLEDEWTVITRDHAVTAHFEHTIVVTERGGQILTSWQA
jgi:methionyl aminopeptidase